MAGARVAATALLRSVASRVARAAPPLHRKEGLLSASLLNGLGRRHNIAWAAFNAAPFLASGVVMCGWVKQIPEEFIESFATASRERSETKEEIIQCIADEFQRIRDLLEHLEFK